MSLRQQLTALESWGLIRLAQARPELEYLFRHALVQEAAYGSLVRQNRLRLHRLVGETLERVYAGRLESRDVAALLAQHFDEAGDAQRALAYYTRAGDAAAAVFANAEAAMLYARALALAPPSSAPRETLLHLHLRRGRALELAAQDAAALRSYEALEAAGRQRADPSMELAALIARATIYVKPSSLADPDQGRRLTEQALRLARALDDREAEARCEWNLLLLHKFTGDAATALKHGEAALARARELGLRELTAYVLNDMFGLYVAALQIQRGKEALAEARRIWSELGIQNMLADNLASSADLQVYTGEHDLALENSAQAWQIGQSIGNLWNQSYSLYSIDLIHLERGDLQQAIDVAERCIALGEQAGFVPAQVVTRCTLAFSLATLGAFQVSLRLIDTALGVARTAMPVLTSLPLAMSAYVHLLRGDQDDAGRLLQEALAHDRPEALEFEGVAFMVITASEVRLARGEYAPVLAEVEQAIALLREMGVRLFLPDALHLHSRALLGLGQVEAAHAAATEARAEAEALRSRRSLWPILVTLSRIEARRGQPAQSLPLLQLAREIVSYIADHTGAPELRASFLALPDVRSVLAVEADRA